MLGLIGVDGSLQGNLVGVTPLETGPGQHAELNLRHVEPTGVFGGSVSRNPAIIEPIPKLGQSRVWGRCSRQLPVAVRTCNLAPAVRFRFDVLPKLQRFVVAADASSKPSVMLRSRQRTSRQSQRWNRNRPPAGVPTYTLQSRSLPVNSRCVILTTIPVSSRVSLLAAWRYRSPRSTTSTNAIGEK